jgi:hypothetical protein
MKRFILLILFAFSNSAQAETYFCQVDMFGNTHLSIISREDTSTFISTSDSGKYVLNIVSENPKALYLMGNFSNDRIGATAKVIDKINGKYTAVYLAPKTKIETVIGYGECLQQ